MAIKSIIKTQAEVAGVEISDDLIEKLEIYAKELKDRYTVLWMHYDLFGGQ